MPATKEMQVVDIYYDVYAQYASKYGKICLLMQVGGFYEMYCTNTLEKSNVKSICDELELKLTIRDPRNDTSPRMAGIPLSALDKHVRILLEKGYTVIIMDQSAADLERPSAKRSRAVTQVISKATDLNSVRTRNAVVAIYCEKFVGGSMAFGLCAIDTTVSREILTHEIHSEPDDRGLAIDTAIEFITQAEPVECIVVTRNGEKNADIVKQLGIPCQVHYMDVQAGQAILNKIRRLSQITTDVDTDAGIKMVDSPLISHSYQVQSAMNGLLTFLDERFFRILDLNVVPYHLDRHLDLSSSCITQLDVTLLYRTLDKTMTRMGTRYLRERLVRPLVDTSELQESYQAIADLTKEREEVIQKGLTGFPDLDRLHRKMSLGRFQWSDMRSANDAYLCALKLLTDVGLADLAQAISDMIRDYETVFDFTYDEARSNLPIPMRPGKFPDLDHYVNKVAWAKKIIDDFVTIAKEIIPCDTYKMKDTLGMQTTHLRAETLRKKAVPRVWKVRKLGASSFVSSEELETALLETREAEMAASRLQTTYFERFIAYFYPKYATTLDRVSRAIAELDFLQCASVLTRDKRLTRPTLVSERCLLIHGLRHLVIEDLNPDTRYVPNDCLLDCGTSPQGRVGMALYGVNACGKSSYLKAVGLAAIMAQAGLYAPAESMTFKTFKRIMTRIAGGDSIEKGLSSFVMELQDLGSVVSRSDRDTLVLGDEMCRGTEIASAEALVHTTLSTLVDAGTPFVTATHLHAIAEEIAVLKGVEVFHMEVKFDADGDPVYDRKLKPGPGESFYGLEIARALGFNAKFMQKACEYRMRKSGSRISEGRPSRYNRKHIGVQCENPSCSFIPQGRNALPLDDHHVDFQCNADNEGFHGTQKKHAAHNLVTLCKQCHIDVHARKISIAVTQTLNKRRKVEVTFP